MPGPFPDLSLVWCPDFPFRTLLIPIYMNKILLLLFLLGMSLAGSLSAQTSLEFSQVIRFSISGASENNTSPPNKYVDTLVTIPAGKVWKLTSANANLTYGYVNSSTNTMMVGYLSTDLPCLFIDNELIYASSYSGGNTRAGGTTIWLPAGTYRFSMRHSRGGTGYNYTATFSGLEFSVVP